MKIHFFESQNQMRKWLEKNHKKETELFVGYHKVGTGKPTVSWSQSVDEALCFGWIDGIRKSIDKDSYMIRFTPRKPNSIWSAINIQKVKDLTKHRMMKPEGIAAFEKRSDSKSRIYSFEQRDVELTGEFIKLFKDNKKAWSYFQSQAPSYQRTAKWLVMSAKQEPTRLKRVQQLIIDSEAGRRIKEVRWSEKSGNTGKSP